MIKKTRLIAVCLLVLAVTAAYCMPAETYAAGTKKKPKADAVEYYTNSAGQKTGIKAITILPYTYYNINGNTADPKTVDLNDAAIQKIAAEQIFPRWGVIAEGIFRDQASQLVTIEGSGMMSSDTTSANSFDRHFSQTRSGVSGHNYSWGLNDLAKELGTPDAKGKHNTAEQSEFSILQGSTNNDEVVYSGIYPINNLKDARTLMGKSLRACADDNDLTVDDFLGNSKDKSGNEYRLPDLDNDKTDGGYCNVVTCVNRAGSSGDYDYVCFGLAVYDFDVTPIAASDLSYIHAAQEYAEQPDPIKAAAEAHAEGVAYSDDPHSTDTFATNKSSQESTTSVSLTTEESEEIGSTTEESFEWGMEQEIGADIGIGPGDYNFARLTLHFQQNFHELWNTMKGSSQTKSKREERSVNQELVLPGHTAANIRQTNNTSKAWQSYQQPVVLNYKVAVFAMSGDYYNGWGGLISDSRYDKQWMSVLFDGSDGCEPGGCNALASLQNRAIVNADTDGYDKTKGKYRSWCDKSGWRYSTKINWNSIAQVLAGDGRATHSIPNYKGEKSSLKDMASQLLFAETARKFTRDRKIMTSEVSSLMPLYNLASVDITSGNSRNYEVRTGDRLYLDGIELGGFDKENVEFYGFDSGLGSWNLSEDDAEGASTDDSGNVTKVTTKDGYLTLNTDKQTGSQWVTIRSEQTTDDKVYHLVWEVDTSKRVMTKESVDADATNPDDIMTVEQLEAVETPSLGVSVKSDTADVKSIEVSGSYTGPYDQEINLNKELDVTVKDTQDALINIPVYWEDNGVKPAEVHESGETTFSTPGTYKVRAYSLNNGQKIASNWIDIEAKAKPALKRIDFSAPSLDEDLLTLTKKYDTRSYDLNSYLKFYDQYGETWEGTEEDPLPTIRFSVDDDNNASIENGILTVSEAGTYTVTARAYNENGNLLSYDIPSLKFRVTAERWLDSVEFAEPAVGRNDLKLHSKDDQIRIENLEGLLRYYDQKGYAWTGETPKISFSLANETGGAEIRSGGGYTFFAYEPGTYTIQPSVEGFAVNPVTIEVTEDPYLVIETRDPVKQPITERGGSVTVDLDKYVNATTQFGGSWKEGLPAMNYTLDEGVTGASIGEATVGEGSDKMTIENAFVADTPGKYTVHVVPKKASAYSGVVDDIEITVYKKRQVQTVTLNFSKLDPNQRTVLEGGEGWSLDLSDHLAYYDQFGDLIRENELSDFDLPKITGFEVDNEFIPAAGGEVTKEGDTWKLTAQSAGTCGVRPVVEGDGYLTLAGHLFLIDSETNENICAALEELLKACEDLCMSHASETSPILESAFTDLLAASSDAEIDRVLQNALGYLKPYEHKAGTPVIENMDPQAATCDEVIYCTDCGRELSRETVSTVQISIADAAVTIPAATYTGRAIAPAATVKVGGTTLTAGTDFVITCTNNINAGTANAIISGKGKYTGTLTKTFTIAPKSVTPAVTLSPASCTYDGKVKTPAVTAKAGSVTLQKGRDYTVSYAAGRKNAGSYKATVTLKGNYKGSAAKSFTIAKAANPLTVKAKTVTVKRSKLKKKSQKLQTAKTLTFTKKGQGTMQYSLVSVKKGSKSYKKIFKINRKTGKVTIKKNTKMKKGTYKMQLRVRAAGNTNYKASASKLVTVKVKVK